MIVYIFITIGLIAIAYILITVDIRNFFPKNRISVCGIILIMIALALYATQALFDWFGEAKFEKYAFSVLVLILTAVGGSYLHVGQKFNNSRKTLADGKVIKEIVKNSLITLFLFFAFTVAFNQTAMALSTEYANYANTEGGGTITGVRELTHITSEDVNSLHFFAIGIREIVSALFLTIPCIIATWGGLSMITADSLDEAEGGPLAVVGAFIVFIIVWIFKAIGVTLLTMSLIVI